MNYIWVKSVFFVVLRLNLLFVRYCLCCLVNLLDTGKRLTIIIHLLSLKTFSSLSELVKSHQLKQTNLKNQK